MPVTDLQVATLRALLVRDFDETRGLKAQIGEEGLRSGYYPLLTSAFVEAAKLQFGGKKPSDIVEWVAAVRAERDPNGHIDPNIAERLILWVFDQASTDDLDFDTEYGHQTMLTGLLVDEQEFDGAGLDAFLQKARDETDAALDKGE